MEEMIEKLRDRKISVPKESITTEGSFTAVERELPEHEKMKGGDGEKVDVKPSGKVWCTACEDYH